MDLAEDVAKTLVNGTQFYFIEFNDWNLVKH